VFNWCIFWG
ncbi:putative rhamnosyl transferase domain protein, partial [Vibrio parahaemolyticus EKP-028]